MKILITNPQFTVYGGAERLIVRLANYLTDHHIPNTILTASMTAEIKRHLHETRIIETNNPPAVAREIIDDFDVINAHNDPAQLYHIPKRKPVLWMCNEPPISYLVRGELRPQERFLVRNFVSTVVVADPFNKTRVERLYGMQAVVNPYGIEFDFFKNGDPERMKRRYALRDAFVILHVGYMTFTKNQLGTVDIFNDVKRSIPNAVLVFAGYDKDPYKNLVLRKVQADGVKDVIFAGELAQEDVRDLYFASDVVISPIRSQGGWLNVFEAMAAGRPTVVSEEMTAASILREHRIGFVARNDYIYDHSGKPLPRSAPAHDGAMDSDPGRTFAQRIIAIHTEGMTHDRKAQQWVRENLSWEDKFCPSMVSYFRELLP